MSLCRQRATFRFLLLKTIRTRWRKQSIWVPRSLIRLIREWLRIIRDLQGKQSVIMPFKIKISSCLISNLNSWLPVGYLRNKVILRWPRSILNWWILRQGSSKAYSSRDPYQRALLILESNYRHPRKIKLSKISRQVSRLAAVAYQ